MAVLPKYGNLQFRFSLRIENSDLTAGIGTIARVAAGHRMVRVALGNRRLLKRLLWMAFPFMRELFTALSHICTSKVWGIQAQSLSIFRSASRFGVNPVWKPRSTTVFSLQNRTNNDSSRS
eukprot:TRINITY_DN6776_c0_g3_i1.p1 TRINITY_DN6776_c0_g3~~TRINITY_DN6776_c0_g3_i1.p1  ORF type:complete len:121 (+),score=12.09 TRINITY_DN6776_c0_g3_i1:66-428(+)